MSKEKNEAVIQIIKQDPSKVVDILLDSSFWIRDLEAGKIYRRTSDDNDGDDKGIKVIIDEQGDVWIDLYSYCYDRKTGDILPDDGSHRFRTHLGGGRSYRTSIALMILARAIELDNRDYPDHRP